jgi:hypothetical protein
VKGDKKEKENHLVPYISIASHMVESLPERNGLRLTDEFTQDASIVKKGSKYIKYKIKYI